MKSFLQNSKKTDQCRDARILSVAPLVHVSGLKPEGGFLLLFFTKLEINVTAVCMPQHVSCNDMPHLLILQCLCSDLDQIGAAGCYR